MPVKLRTVAVAASSVMVSQVPGHCLGHEMSPETLLTRQARQDCDITDFFLSVVYAPCSAQDATLAHAWQPTLIHMLAACSAMAQQCLVGDRALQSVGQAMLSNSGCRNFCLCKSSPLWLKGVYHVQQRPPRAGMASLQMLPIPHNVAICCLQQPSAALQSVGSACRH